EHDVIDIALPHHPAVVLDDLLIVRQRHGFLAAPEHLGKQPAKQHDEGGEHNDHHDPGQHGNESNGSRWLIGMSRPLRWRMVAATTSAMPASALRGWWSWHRRPRSTCPMERTPWVVATSISRPASTPYPETNGSARAVARRIAYSPPSGWRMWASSGNSRRSSGLAVSSVTRPPPVGWSPKDRR